MNINTKYTNRFHAELCSLSEVYSFKDAEEKFVKDFVIAWVKSWSWTALI